MSELHLTDKETRGFPEKGPDAYLSAAEQAFLQRILSHPESFPKAFWTAVMQKVALDGELIPHSQIQGFSQVSPTVAEVVGGGETTTSTTYTNLSTVGPTIEGLSDGLYLIGVSCFAQNTADVTSFMGVEINGITPADDSEACGGFGKAFVGGGTSTFNQFPKRLENNNNNILVAKYRVLTASTGTFFYRRITALKIGN